MQVRYIERKKRYYVNSSDKTRSRSLQNTSDTRARFELASQYGLSYDVADNMANTYGTRAHEVQPGRALEEARPVRVY